MPKSRLRGGKKEHRKRVQKRNENIKNQQGKIQKLWEEEMNKRMEELKLSGETQNEPQSDIEQPLIINPQ